jgi:hypothetical protein
VARMAPLRGYAGPVEFTRASVSLLNGESFEPRRDPDEKNHADPRPRTPHPDSWRTLELSLYALNDDPQPQVREARGLSKRNPAPCRPST